MNNKRAFALTTLAATFSLGFSQAATAEGFYFGVFGGVASVDLPTSDIDQIYEDAIEVDAQWTVANLHSSTDDSDKAWGIQIGYSWNSYVALEVGYVNLGRASHDSDFDVLFDAAPVGGPVTVFDSFSRTTFESSGPTLAVVGTLPLNAKFDVFGRVGILVSDTRIAFSVENDPAGEIKGEDKDVLFGVGGNWNINEDYALRLEYQRFLDVGDEMTGEQDVDLIALSVLFR